MKLGVKKEEEKRKAMCHLMLKKECDMNSNINKGWNGYCKC